MNYSRGAVGHPGIPGIPSSTGRWRWVPHPLIHSVLPTGEIRFREPFSTGNLIFIMLGRVLSNRQNHIVFLKRRGSQLRVVLLKDIPKLGSRNDTISVKRGFARNFLIPEKLAVYPQPSQQNASVKEEVLRRK